MGGSREPPICSSIPPRHLIRPLVYVTATWSRSPSLARVLPDLPVHQPTQEVHMTIVRLLLATAVLGIAACNQPVGPATDCVYDKTAAAAPGYQICSTPVVIPDAQDAF